MDQYLSTYSKDYVWPPAKKLSARTAGRAELFSELGPCVCGAEPGGYTTPRDYGATQVGENCQWSRLDPMGPLLDPKLYPAKLGPGPECDVTRYDQPDTYMRKLQEKYPYIYNVLRGAPSEDITQFVNEDRLRTTYQVDYGHVDEHPTGNYDNPPGESGFPSDPSKNAALDCRARVGPPNYGDRGEEHHAENGTSGGAGSGSNGSGGGANGYAGASGGANGRAATSGGANGRAATSGGANGRAATSGGAASGSGGPQGRSLAVKALRSGGGGGGATGKKSDGGADGERGKRGDSEAANTPLPVWASEYNEGIGQTGFDIVRDKIHQHGGKSPGRVFIERAVMRCRNHVA